MVRETLPKTAIVGISVKNADLSFHQTLHLGTNSLQCLTCPGKNQQNQIQRLCVEGTGRKGLPPYPDNSVSLKAKETVCPAPSCILEQLSDLHTSRQQKHVIQTPRSAGGPEEAQEAGSDGGMTHL